MVGIRGGLLASAAVTAVAFARFDGGAAGLLDDDTGAAGADGGQGGGDGGQGGGDGGQGGGDGGQGGGDGGQGGETPAIADWMKGYSGEKAGDELSHQEWLAKIGAKDHDDVVKRFRDTQKALREGGKVKIPGADATEEERAAFREAIGAPKEADGYKVKMPEGAEQYEIDSAFLDPMKAAAHKHGISTAAFEELGSIFMAAQLEDAKAEAAARDADAAEKIKEWGAQAPQRKEEYKRGATLLGLTKADIAKIEEGFGSAATLELFAKIGQLAGEDFFAQGNPSQRFGLASLEDAQKQLDAMIDDPAIGKALREGTDKALRAKYDRLTEAVGAFKAQAAGRKR